MVPWHHQHLQTSLSRARVCHPPPSSFFTKLGSHWKILCQIPSLQGGQGSLQQLFFLPPPLLSMSLNQRPASSSSSLFSLIVVLPGLPKIFGNQIPVVVTSGHKIRGQGRRVSQTSLQDVVPPVLPYSLEESDEAAAPATALNRVCLFLLNLPHWCCIPKLLIWIRETGKILTHRPLVIVWALTINQLPKGQDPVV